MLASDRANRTPYRVVLPFVPGGAEIGPALMLAFGGEIALLVNPPGNTLLGGGGIARAAGLCRLFALPGPIATLAVAVAPVPLAFMLPH